MQKNLSRILFFLIAISSILFLSGCKANIITRINPDGSGTFVEEIGFTAEEVSSLNSMGTSGTSFCSSTESEMSSMPANTVMSEETRGDETWCIFEAPFATLEELKSAYGSTDIVINDISLANGKIRYDIGLDMSTGDFGSTTYGLLDMKWIVEMPGKVSNHNADEINGSTLTWTLTPGENLNMVAESSTSSATIWWIIGGMAVLCLCLLVILAVGLVIFFVVRKNKKAQVPQVPLENINQGG
jgi:hypothetical protein